MTVSRPLRDLEARLGFLRPALHHRSCRAAGSGRRYAYGNPLQGRPDRPQGRPSFRNRSARPYEIKLAQANAQLQMKNRLTPLQTGNRLARPPAKKSLRVATVPKRETRFCGRSRGRAAGWTQSSPARRRGVDYATRAVPPAKKSQPRNEPKDIFQRITSAGKNLVTQTDR